MKGATWVLVLLGLLAAVYLVGNDLKSVRGEREGRAVVEPLQRAREAAAAADASGKVLEEAARRAAE
jgi:hypothetical protein